MRCKLVVWKNFPFQKLSRRENLECGREGNTVRGDRKWFSRLWICFSCFFHLLSIYFSECIICFILFFNHLKIKTLCLVCVMYACIYVFICIFKLEFSNNFKNSNLLSAYGHWITITEIVYNQHLYFQDPGHLQSARPVCFYTLQH